MEGHKQARGAGEIGMRGAEFGSVGGETGEPASPFRAMSGHGGQPVWGRGGRAIGGRGSGITVSVMMGSARVRSVDVAVVGISRAHSTIAVQNASPLGSRLRHFLNGVDLLGRRDGLRM